MALKATFTKADIQKALRQNFADKLYVLYLEKLQVVGEEAVRYAREINTYKDQTGNLRSSIGYMIFYNGSLVDRNFKKVKDGDQGIAEGEKHAARKMPKTGFALVVVAGMDYALAVQTRGYDVLDGAESYAERELQKQLQSVKSQIDKWGGNAR